MNKKSDLSMSTICSSESRQSKDSATLDSHTTVYSVRYQTQLLKGSRENIQRDREREKHVFGLNEIKTKHVRAAL